MNGAARCPAFEYAVDLGRYTHLNGCHPRRAAPERAVNGARSRVGKGAMPLYSHPFFSFSSNAKFTGRPLARQ